MDVKLILKLILISSFWRSELNDLAQDELDFWVPVTTLDPGVPSQGIALPSDHLGYVSLTGQLVNSECSSNRRTTQVNRNRSESVTKCWQLTVT